MTAAERAKLIAEIEKAMYLCGQKGLSEKTDDQLFGLYGHEAKEVVATLTRCRAALESAAPADTALEATEQTILIAQELVRVRCAGICSEVDAISGWDGDPTDTGKRFKAGVSSACEEIKFRIEDIDFKATWEDAIARQLDPLAAPSADKGIEP